MESDDRTGFAAWTPPWWWGPTTFACAVHGFTTTDALDPVKRVDLLARLRLVGA